MNSFDLQVPPEEKMSFDQFTPEEREEFEAIQDEVEKKENIGVMGVDFNTTCGII